MGKYYLDLDDHGYNGDFYRFNDGTERGSIYRADNLKIATQIAFNEWLSNFDNIYYSCILVSLTPGRFIVSISKHDRGTGCVIQTESETFTVEYYGPADMFTAEYKCNQAIKNNPEYQRMIQGMCAAYCAGNENVRYSKRSSSIIFSESVIFPRYKFGYNALSAEEQMERFDEYYISSESLHLDYDDIEIARIQMQSAKIAY